MGYILPVTHYTYSNYQNRIQQKRKSPHYIERKQRVTFHEVFAELEDNTESEHPIYLKKQKQYRRMRHDEGMYRISQHKKAVITGKGQTVNARI